MEGVIKPSRSCGALLERDPVRCAPGGVSVSVWFSESDHVLSEKGTDPADVVNYKAGNG